jgi:hypothetical protein
MVEQKQGPFPQVRRGGLQATSGLGDLQLEVDGERVELSLPDEGPRRLQFGGSVAFGFAAPDHERIRGFLHRRGVLRDEEGARLGELMLRELDPEIDVASGDLYLSEEPVAQH